LVLLIVAARKGLPTPAKMRRPFWPRRGQTPEQAYDDWIRLEVLKQIRILDPAEELGG
jgi:hypothetical protein